MDCKIKMVNNTRKYDLYCCWFGDFATGTMLLDKAEKLQEWCETQESISLQQATRCALRNNFDLWYATPLKKII